MRLDEFRPEAVPPGAKETLYLDVAPLPDGDTLRLAVLVARGGAAGPTLLVLGGVHGDEYEGPHAVRTVFRALAAGQLRGTFIGVPVTNVPAFEAGTRSSPLDGLNLARVFPGRRAGTPTERIAYQVGNHLIGRCDLLIDLHSSGTHAAMPTLVGYYADDSEVGRRSRAAAFAFGAPVVWGHSSRGAGSHGERGDGAWHPLALHRMSWRRLAAPGYGALYARGVTNVMRQLGMLPGDPEREPPHYHLHGSGRIEDALAVRSSGFLLPAVRPLGPGPARRPAGPGARTGRRGTRGATRQYRRRADLYADYPLGLARRLGLHGHRGGDR